MFSFLWYLLFIALTFALATIASCFARHKLLEWYAAQPHRLYSEIVALVDPLPNGGLMMVVFAIIFELMQAPVLSAILIGMSLALLTAKRELEAHGDRWQHEIQYRRETLSHFVWPSATDWVAAGGLDEHDRP